MAGKAGEGTKDRVKHPVFTLVQYIFLMTNVLWKLLTLLYFFLLHGSELVVVTVL